MEALTKVIFATIDSLRGNAFVLSVTLWTAPSPVIVGLAICPTVLPMPALYINAICVHLEALPTSVTRSVLTVLLERITRMERPRCV
jgi:hypothetical protein